MVTDKNNQSECIDLDKVVNVPIDFYQSLLGRYFTAQTPDLLVTDRGNAWGALRNPLNSGVILRINVVTLNYIYGEPLTVGFYMNAELPGTPRESDMIAPANTALSPLPESKIKLFYAEDAPGFPEGGEFSFSRTAYPGQLTILEKGGVFAVPPGGNYCVFLDNLEAGQNESSVYIAFGFWVEPV